MRERPPALAERVDVLGVEVSATTLPDAVATIGGWVAFGTRQYVCVTGVHGVMESVRDPSLRDVHNRSGLTTTDGMPLVWACHRAGAGRAQRVYGPDLLPAVAEESARHGWRNYFYGGAPGVASAVGERLAARVPGFVTCGTYSPPFRPLTAAEEDEVARRINAARPDLVWVGLSTPKQERWMAAMRDRLDAAVLVGVGAAFDIHAGRLRQAPVWVQRRGLEWAFRLAVEPRRLWRRYLRNNPSFALRVLCRPPRLVVADGGSPTSRTPAAVGAAGELRGTPPTR
jgi:N-acetylglucosaminyldiphosphoundecaprenol N-acetyl-beta-D-mannosaminyltransferase